jgi:3',5'-cyclic AMP phosphodiesterase CpdA
VSIAPTRVKGQGVFVLAHLSDPHLAPLPPARLTDLASKRLLGYANWHRRRHRVHRREVLDALMDDLRRQAPDHVAVTGDLVNIALPTEFAQARAWLESLGRPDDVSVVPGNHDAYVAGARRHREAQWAPYMAGDATAEIGTDDAAATFPYLRRRGPVALIGLSTAVPTAPLMATGRLGTPQVARLGAMLTQTGAAGLFRVVMMHHPPLGAAAARHKHLIDSRALAAAVAAAGAELIIHGHDHVHALNSIAGPAGRAAVIGVPSASAAAGSTHHAGAYHLYRIDGVPGAWTCEVIVRGLLPTCAIREIKRFGLSW